MLKFIILGSLCVVLIIFSQELFAQKGTVSVSKENFEQHLKNQISMVPETLIEVREAGVDDKNELKIEFLLYTNESDKGSSLSEELKKINYSVSVSPSAYNPNDILINGWTTRMIMSEANLISWVNKMCDLGYKYDCEFDGWGTDPNQ